VTDSYMRLDEPRPHRLSWRAFKRWARGTHKAEVRPPASPAPRADVGVTPLITRPRNPTPEPAQDRPDVFSDKTT
jgi:hypothetical protein